MNETSTSKQAVLDAARRLSVGERVDVFLSLREELRKQTDPEPSPLDETLSPAEIGELDRRFASLESDANAGMAWDDVEKKLAERGV